jgi:hypothetical protein
LSAGFSSLHFINLSESSVNRAILAAIPKIRCSLQECP